MAYNRQVKHELIWVAGLERSEVELFFFLRKRSGREEIRVSWVVHGRILFI